MKSEGANPPVRITLERIAGYEFGVRVEGTAVPAFVAEEGPPLGESRGPSPDALLAAAVGSCLSSSLLFCLEKARVSVDGLHTRVDLEKTRNERGRLRVGSLRVEISVDVPNELRDRFERCRSIFEDYCTITESVRHGVPVEVNLTPSSSGSC